MKRYPFSARKYAHDLSFRRDRCRNEIAQIETLGGDATPQHLLLDALDEILNYCVGLVPVIWLTGSQLALAKDSVLWAESQRR